LIRLLDVTHRSYATCGNIVRKYFKPDIAKKHCNGSLRDRSHYRTHLGQKFPANR